jgi:hypothetical protein
LRAQFIISVIALVMTTGCAKRPPAVDFEKEFLQEKAKYEPNIGKSFWLVGSRSLCPTTTTSIIDCPSIPPGKKLQLDGIERGINSNAYYYVTLEDGRTGYISALDLVAFITDVDPALAVAECKRRGNPRVGMTRNQVEGTCWGKPDRVDHRETARGVTERYVYGKSRFVLLHNGIVTSVQISSKLH